MRLLMRLTFLCALLCAPVFAAEEVAEHHEEPGMIWKWANFLILAGGLGYLISKHAPPFFHARNEAIQGELREARKMSEESEARVVAIEKKVANLSSEVQSLRDTAKAEMNAEADRIRLDAARAMEKLQAKGQNEIAFAAKLAQQELKAFAADLAIELAAAQVRERLTPAKNEELANGFIRHLATIQKVTH